MAAVIASHQLLGLVVRPTIARSNQVAAELAQWPGVEIHGQGEQGQLVVTVEGDSRKAVLAMVDAIEQFPGVVAVSLAYSHSDLPPANGDEE